MADMKSPVTSPIHHIYDYNLKKYPEIRSSGNILHKIVVLLGRLYSIMKQAPELRPSGNSWDKILVFRFNVCIIGSIT